MCGLLPSPVTPLSSQHSFGQTNRLQTRHQAAKGELRLSLGGTSPVLPARSFRLNGRRLQAWQRGFMWQVGGAVGLGGGCCGGDEWLAEGAAGLLWRRGRTTHASRTKGFWLKRPPGRVGEGLLSEAPEKNCLGPPQQTAKAPRATFLWTSHRVIKGKRWLCHHLVSGLGQASLGLTWPKTASKAAICLFQIHGPHFLLSPPEPLKQPQTFPRVIGQSPART